jgi:hypothetical protein
MRDSVLQDKHTSFRTNAFWLDRIPWQRINPSFGINIGMAVEMVPCVPRSRFSNRYVNLPNPVTVTPCMNMRFAIYRAV